MQVYLKDLYDRIQSFKYLSTLFLLPDFKNKVFGKINHLFVSPRLTRWVCSNLCHKCFVLLDGFLLSFCTASKHYIV